MNSKEENHIEENIKMLLKHNEHEFPYNTILETQIMEQIETEVDHSKIIARDQHLARVCFWICIALVGLLAIFILKDSLQFIQQQSKAASMNSLYSTLFSFVGIFILYIQVEWSRIFKA